MGGIKTPQASVLSTGRENGILEEEGEEEGEEEDEEAGKEDQGRKRR